VTTETSLPSFRELGLTDSILEALAAVGYETPSPIQARTIPALLGGADVLGQAQTGTGKTAAFALPILAQLDLQRTVPQALVLVPTRELAIQVAEAFQKYASHMPGFHVLPIYGGQSYTPQLKALKRGTHVIVGTPGRVIDHMKSGALDLSGLKVLVLDEGDEMLQMGFVDDIEWVLEQAPAERQIALFSATMPPAMRRIAQKHMRDPESITIQNRAGTGPKIRQRYWLVSGMHKLDALTRVLEVTRFDAMLIFVRTKLETVELAERLEARGFGAAALNGDIQQQQRERTVARLKAGQLDILVATDVAARGLDVERISHVVNYDIPYDSETYIHRIGRTGRAGRSGEAILFVAPRERNMLRIIESATKQRLEEMALPSVADVNEQRALKFKERVAAAVQNGQGRPFEELLRQIEHEQNIPAIEIGAALAGLLQGSAPFLLAQKSSEAAAAGKPAREWQPVIPERSTESSERAPARASHEREPGQSERRPRDDGLPMETYRIEVGHVHGVQPGNIVGAIANEAGLEGNFIGHVDIREDHTFVDLPEGMPVEILGSLKKVKVRGEALRISRVDSKPPRPERTGRGGFRNKGSHASHKPAHFEHRKGKSARPRK
jgi:ATP-dependent RNA helicase DeaD